MGVNIDNPPSKKRRFEREIELVRTEEKDEEKGDGEENEGRKKVRRQAYIRILLRD